MLPIVLTSSVNGPRDTPVELMAIKACGTGADDYLRKHLDGAEFQATLDRTISCLTLAWQHATLRRHLGTEQ
jgi:DNA-binding response OmpR family regulator